MLKQVHYQSQLIVEIILFFHLHSSDYSHQALRNRNNEQILINHIQNEQIMVDNQVSIPIDSIYNQILPSNPINNPFYYLEIPLIQW